MKDRKPKYPGRVMLTPVEGQIGVYDMERADEPEDIGTPLNKNTFLTDETAAEMGLDPAADPTPNDALAALMARMLADGNGIMQKMMQMLKGDSNVGIMNGENKKIFGYGVDGKFYTGDPEYPLTLRGSAENPTYNTFDMLKVQTGSYTGAGKSATAKNTLTFSFTPKIVIVYETQSGDALDTAKFMIAIYGTNAGGTQYTIDNTDSIGVRTYGVGCKFTWTTKSLSWIPINTTCTAFYRLDESGKSYKWIAIG